MMSFNYWIEDTTTGGIKFKVNTLLPFEYQFYSISKTEGYEPESSEPTNASPASTEPTVTIEDMGTWYKMMVVNETGDTLSDYWVEYIPTSDLSLTSTSDSLRITQIDHGVSFEPYKDLFENCVAYWDFIGNAKDVIGNSDGTVSGATLTTDRLGIQNAAYNFDGNDIIDLPSTIPVGGEYHKITVMVWVKLGSTSGYQTLITAGGKTGSTASDSGFEIMIYDGKPSIMISGKRYLTTSNNALDTTSWHLIGFTLDGNGDVPIFIDGEQNTSVTYNTQYNTSSVSYYFASTSPVTPSIGCRHLYHLGSVTYDQYATCEIGEIFIFQNETDTNLHSYIFNATSCGKIYPIMTGSVGGLLE